MVDFLPSSGAVEVMGIPCVVELVASTTLVGATDAGVSIMVVGCTTASGMTDSTAESAEPALSDEVGITGAVEEIVDMSISRKRFKWKHIFFECNLKIP